MFKIYNMIYSKEFPREPASCDCCHFESVYDWQKQTLLLGLGSVLKLTSDWVTPCWQFLSPLSHSHTPAFCLLLSPSAWHWGQWGIRQQRSRRWGEMRSRGDQGTRSQAGRAGCHQWHKWVISTREAPGHKLGSDVILLMSWLCLHSWQNGWCISSYDLLSGTRIMKSLIETWVTAAWLCFLFSPVVRAGQRRFEFSKV